MVELCFICALECLNAIFGSSLFVSPVERRRVERYLRRHL